MKVEDIAVVHAAIEFAPTKLRQQAMLALRDDIVANGFVVTGLNARGLVEKLSQSGMLTEVLKEACAMYGFDLRIATDVQHTLDATLAMRSQLLQHLIDSGETKPDHA
jgi:hypothetical protein